MLKAKGTVAVVLLLVVVSINPGLQTRIWATIHVWAFWKPVVINQNSAEVEMPPVVDSKKTSKNQPPMQEKTQPVYQQSI